MKLSLPCLLICVATWAHSQTASKPADPAQSHPTIADFGLVYPLSNEWVRATRMLRNKVESSDPSNLDLLLAAVYVPKSDVSNANPFFTLLAIRQPATDCKKSLEAMIAEPLGKKIEGGVQQFSAAGRDYFRVNLARGVEGLHQSIICTAASGHLLIWRASAAKEKGLDTIVATLNSITPLPGQNARAAQSTGSNDGAAEGSLSKPDAALPQRMNVSTGVASGLLIKRVNPIYPAEARSAYIQGTIMLRAEISKTGDITDLELVGGPIELAGSAVVAVRQWKYKPYLFNGQPVIVDTLIQVNYQLR